MIHLAYLFPTDEKSTLLVAFQVPNLKRDTTTLSDIVESSFHLMRYRGNKNFSDLITDLMMEKLTAFPTAPKLVVTPTWNTYPSKELEKIPELLHVEYTADEGALGNILEVLSKRLQTLDLISIMKEVQRTRPKYGWNGITKITDNLSAVPKFQPTPEQP